MLLSLIIFIIGVTKASLITKVDPEFSKNIIYYNSNFLQNNSSLDLLNVKKMDKYELVHFVSSLNKMSHPPIYFLEPAITKSNSLFKSLIQILKEDHDHDFDPVDAYFTSINDLLDDFSEHCKSYCLDVMYSLKKHGGFLLKDEKKMEKGKEDKTNVERGGAFFFAAAAAFVSGDIIAPVSVFLTDDTAAAAAIPNKPLDDDFSYSKVYCINTFSLFFALESNKRSDNKRSDNKRSDNKRSLTIYGDKIPYEYFIKMVNLLEERIKDKDNDNDNDTESSVFLENIVEQLEALKIVVSKLDELVVLELHDKLTNMIELGASFPKIQKYLSNKVSELVVLKQDVLLKDFPISKSDVSELARLNAVKRDLERIKHTDQMINVKQVSDQRVTKNVLQHELNEKEFATWAILYVYGPLKRTSSLITRAVVSLPEGVAVGGLQGVYDFIGSICNIFTGNPVTTGLIIIGGLAVIYSSVANIFHIAYNFVSWVFFPFLFVKKFVCRLFC
jgi:hypothetical protein